MRKGLSAVFAAHGPSPPRENGPSGRRRHSLQGPAEEDLLVCSERRHLGGVFKST